VRSCPRNCTVAGDKDETLMGPLTQPVPIAHTRRVVLRSYLGKAKATDFAMRLGRTLLIVGGDYVSELLSGLFSAALLFSF